MAVNRAYENNPIPTVYDDAGPVGQRFRDGSSATRDKSHVTSEPHDYEQLQTHFVNSEKNSHQGGRKRQICTILVTVVITLLLAVIAFMVWYFVFHEK